MPVGFYDDWVKSADEESRHFNLISDCLEEMGSHYGALPAHAGMWRAAEDTAHDLMGRLAVVPMVLEARGLDVTPGMIDIFRRAGATSAVEAMQVIYSEEVHHVAYGAKWFHFLCGAIFTGRSGRPLTRKSAPRRACHRISTGRWPNGWQPRVETPLLIGKFPRNRRQTTGQSATWDRISCPARPCWLLSLHTGAAGRQEQCDSSWRYNYTTSSNATFPNDGYSFDPTRTHALSAFGPAPSSSPRPVPV
jgi:hypothetical protein